MKNRVLSLLCISIVLLSGCSKNPSETITPSSEISSETDNETGGNVLTSDYFTITYENEENVYRDDDDSVTLLYSSYNTPTVTIPNNKEASAAIKSALSAEFSEYNTTRSEYLVEAHDFYNEYPQTFSSYSLNWDYSAKRCDEQVISLVRYRSDYLGGAHDSYSYKGLNFDAKTGKQLTLNDIAADKTALINSAQRYINSQLTLPFYYNSLLLSIDEAEKTVADEVITDDNWYFTPSGLTFVANVYVLGSYASGASFFTIPYQKLDGLKQEYQYTGAFVTSGLVGTTLSADIDGNEETDAIYYNTCTNEYGELVSTLTLNGTDYSYLLNNEEVPLSYGSTIGGGLEYYLIDLDASDSYIELAIQDIGEDALSNKTYFFRYIDFDLVYIGSVDDLIQSSTFRSNEDGTLLANVRFPILNGAFAPAQYEIKKDSIVLLKQDWYYLSSDMLHQKDFTCEILSDLTVYEENKRLSDTVTLTPADGPITLLATDNKDWIMLKDHTDTTYYLYVKDMTTLDSGQNLSEVLAVLE